VITLRLLRARQGVRLHAVHPARLIDPRDGLVSRALA
jgi:hypothetical protein